MKISNSISLKLIAFLLFVLVFTGCRPTSWRLSWPVYKADAASSSYSSADQINRTNVKNLEVAWSFDPGDVPPGVRYGKYECNPIVIDGMVYASSARKRFYAIDAGNGQKIWEFDPFGGGKGGKMCRGVTYWSDSHEERIFCSAENFLYALNADNGQLITSFGTGGKVDLEQNLGVDPDSIWWQITTPGIIYQDLLIVGGEVSESYGAAPGHIRAYNVKSGLMEWIFHTIPHPGEFGYDTWPEEAWKSAGGANNWGGMCLDKENGIVFVPLGSPTYDFYGADRKGKNLFGNSLVALDAESGERIWHFQTTHHDLWDYDLPAPPNLVMAEKNGQEIQAVSLTTKTGFIFLFDRITGEPIYPIEERPVPAASVPGEEAWPTQPIPGHPPPFARQSMTKADITDVSTAAFDSVWEKFRTLRSDGLYTPAEEQGTVLIPGTRGGAEWGGSAYDPNTGILYLNSNESPEILTLRQPQPTRREEITFYDLGEKYYQNYCANCHGTNKEGDIANPPLHDIRGRLSKGKVIETVKVGGGRMPGFQFISENEEKAIVSYLFNEGKDEFVSGRSTPVSQNGYRNITSYSYFQDHEGYPAIQPPWGTLNAYNCRSGQYVWQVTLGNFPDKQKSGGPPTGAENWGGPLVTAGGLVFIAATKDEKFRAFDSASGDQLWETNLPGGGFATPATYIHKRKQYIIIAVTPGIEYPSGAILSFALP